MFLNPIYEFSWATFLVHDFIYLFVKEETLGFLDHTLEVFSVF